MQPQQSPGPEPTKRRGNFSHDGLEPVVVVKENQVVR
jgi:hypothetical protein